MAERRMFAKSIIDSDAFLDMPLSAQTLYFHLSMRADDEGFINNHKKIQRMIGASDDDFKILLAKNFVIRFESGVIVIKHWKIHNYIRSDRLIQTNYQEEKNLLGVKENGAYIISDDLVELEELSAKDKRKMAYQKSSLPYSFNYKMKRAFENKICPICKRRMTSSCRTLVPTIQHNKPISKGGSHELDNISIICESCNASIKDNETGNLNNLEAVEMWDKIVIAEKSNIDWFMNPEILKDVNVSHLSVTCQSNVSIGKDSIGKDSIGKDSINISDSKESDCQKPQADFRHAIELWNSLEDLGIKPVSRIDPSAKRFEMLRARIRQYGMKEYENAINRIRGSDFLQGKHSGRPWQITFDWFVKPNNFPKVLEGNYDNAAHIYGDILDNIS